MKNLLRVLRFFRPDGPRMGVVFLLLLGSIGLNVLKPWPLALLVDSVLGAKALPHWLESAFGSQPKTTQIAVLAAFIFVFHAGQGIISAAQNYISIKIGLRGLTRVRNEVFACLQRLSWRFHQGAKSGDILYRASWDTYSFQTLFQQGLITFVTAFLSLVVMVVVMARLNGPLTLVALATVPLLLVTIKFFAGKMTERGVAAQQADSIVTSHIQQSMAALPLIQSCTREADEEEKFTRHTAASQQQRLSQHGWELVYWLGIALVFAVGTVAIVWIGSRQVLENRLTVGELLIFLAYLTQLYEPLNQLSHVGATLTGAGAGTRRVFEILDSPEEVTEDPQARSLVRFSGASSSSTVQVVRGNLAFEKISFAYEKDREVLHEVSFEVNAGESVALIGPSGAGKSTLLNLVPRFFDPNGGSIRLDGVDLRQLRLKDLRQQIALVLQEPIILPTTIAENIAYGRPEASFAEIEAAALAANADGFIRQLPKKYETIIGDGAARVSVGEKQRLNLARAFLKDAPIVLLDEPTSALDAESEALVVASLEKLMRGRTVLMVAHRLSTIRQMKKIVVLGNGRLLEMGTQDGLLQKDSYYARMIGGRLENLQK